jgi:alkylated DNA repair dioxygenase AlkB
MQQFLFNSDQNILPFQGEVHYYPIFFSPEESEKYFEYLTFEINWKQEPIQIFGRKIMQPRLTAWYGDSEKDYSYSGITMHPHRWTNTLLEIKQKIDSLAEVKFSSALLNLYRNGKDSMGWHRDNEKELGTNPIIASVSFGASRIFQLRNYKDKALVKSIELSSGSLLLMKGETQHFWEHRIPKTSKQIGSRINLTFRVIV